MTKIKRVVSCGTLVCGVLLPAAANVHAPSIGSRALAQPPLNVLQIVLLLAGLLTISCVGHFYRRTTNAGATTNRQHDTHATVNVLNEHVFDTMVGLERKRAERSGSAFLLMMLDAEADARGSAEQTLRRAAPAIMSATRQTDFLGWQGQQLGVMFTGISAQDGSSVPEILRAKVGAALAKNLGAELAAKISISLPEISPLLTLPKPVNNAVPATGPHPDAAAPGIAPATGGAFA